MTLPNLGVLADHTDSSRVAPLLVALRAWCSPLALDPSLGPPGALLATSPMAVGLDAALAGPIPVAVIADDASRITDRHRARATAIIVSDEATAASLGDRGILWRREAILVADHPSLSPFVRSRWRERLGLPSPLVLEFGTADPSWIDDDTAASALAVCSAAVIRGPWLMTALALGTAVVTDEAVADHVGATPFVHLATAGPNQARDLAETIAADPARAASLGWGGRLLVEQRYDLGTVALDIIDALDLGPETFAGAPLGRLDSELDALGTPTASSVANRAFRRAAPIAGPADWTELTGRRR